MITLFVLSLLILWVNTSPNDDLYDFERLTTISTTEDDSWRDLKTVTSVKFAFEGIDYDVGDLKGRPQNHDCYWDFERCILDIPYSYQQCNYNWPSYTKYWSVFSICQTEYLNCYYRVDYWDNYKVSMYWGQPTFNWTSWKWEYPRVGMYGELYPWDAGHIFNVNFYNGDGNHRCHVDTSRRALTPEEIKAARDEIAEMHSNHDVLRRNGILPTKNYYFFAN